jgi:hypothetical protein
MRVFRVAFHRRRPDFVSLIECESRAVGKEGPGNSLLVVAGQPLRLAGPVRANPVHGVPATIERAEDDRFAVRSPERPPVATGQKASTRCSGAIKVLHPDVHTSPGCNRKRQALAIGREAGMIKSATLRMERFQMAAAIQPGDRLVGASRPTHVDERTTQ